MGTVARTHCLWWREIFALSRILFFVLAGLLLFAGPADAGSFQLARADGRGWVSPGNDGHPSVYLFWDETCPHCLLELENLPTLLSRYKELTFVAVYMGPRQSARRAIGKRALPPTVTSAISPYAPHGLLADLGNAKGVLPFASVFEASGRLCGTHFGEISAIPLQRILEKCP